jgi:3,4-dihydroxy 2-butanone 4-phosphate synthase/GTP cyclohydrolase II
MPNSQDFVSIEEALAELKAGRMIVLLDDEQRENEGDFVIAAECATPEAINFMVRNGCGILSLAMAGKICDRLHLEVAAASHVDGPSTAFTQNSTHVLASRRGLARSTAHAPSPWQSMKTPHRTT